MRPHRIKNNSTFDLVLGIVVIGVIIGIINAASGQPKTETVTETAAISCSTERIDDPTLDKGKEVVTRECKNGTKTTTYEVTTKNGKETGRRKLKEEITTKPVNKQIKVGTYVAPVVQQPVATPRYRVGATCNDGSHSSATGRGACSHHGGVRQWLYNR
jgi:hypothetical protein